jgi:hypothetical protein
LKDVQVTGEASSFKRKHLALQNMKFFHSFFFVFFEKLTNADADPQHRFNAGTISWYCAYQVGKNEPQKDKKERNVLF